MQDDLRSWLLRTHSDTVDSDRLQALRWELSQVIKAGIPGEVVELGCYKGASSLWLRSVLDELGADARIHVYDSFQGLPEPGSFDSEYLGAGDVSAPSDLILELHHQWGKTPPIVHAGWFQDTLLQELPAQICFAYLDGDLYDSILLSLQACIPRLAPGGVLIIDDYADLARNPKAWDGLPGVKKACDDFFGRSAALDVLIGEGDLAYGVYRAPGV